MPTFLYTQVLLGEEGGRLMWLRDCSEDGWPMGLWGQGEDRQVKGLLDRCKGYSELVGLLDREGLLEGLLRRVSI